MSEERNHRVITPMPDALLRAIDDFRFGNRLASRSEAIRRLIELGLEAGKTEPSKWPRASGRRKE
jgi:metal-responsive CopG/Arc/MetJ family transcriptional regulator